MGQGGGAIGRIGLVGGGFMGEAIVAAVLRGKLAAAQDVIVSDVAGARREQLASSYGVAVTADNGEAVAGRDVVVLAVKPQEFSAVASGLRGRFEASQTVLSIMAGVPLTRISTELDHQAVVRVMPNVAATVGEAMSVWIAGEGVSEPGRAAVARLLAVLGRELEVRDEQHVDMATALSGSGPGFLFEVIDAMIEGGMNIGLSRETAEELAAQTLLGSGRLARELGKHPAELRAMVTSKGGTTAAGLQVLEDAGLRAAVAGAVEAAYERARELGA